MFGSGTTIKQALHDIYLNYNSSKVHEEMFTTQVEWMLYNPSPPYLTDGRTCIMLDMCSDVRHPPPVISPYSAIRTSYYNTFKDCLKLFNCSQEVLQQVDPNDPYPMPYTPYFHFRERFTQFKQDRQDKGWMSSRCTKLRIKQWQMVWVNIANTGYVAPIIRIFKFDKMGEVAVLNSDVHSILYDEQTIKRSISYWKQLVIKALPPEISPAPHFQLNGLFGVEQPRKVNPPFLNLDLHSTLLNGPTTSRDSENYVLLSTKELRGDHFVNQPLTSQVQKETGQTGALNFRLKHQNKIFYQNREDQDSSKLNSSSEEDDPLEGYHEAQERAHKISSDEQEVESQNDEDNFLFKLYRRSLGADVLKKVYRQVQPTVPPAVPNEQHQQSQMIEEPQPSHHEIAHQYKGEQENPNSQRSIPEPYVKRDEQSSSPDLSD